MKYIKKPDKTYANGTLTGTLFLLTIIHINGELFMQKQEYQQVLDRIVQFRRQVGKSQVELGNHASLSQAQMCRLEAGVNRYQAETLREYAKLGMDIDYVITGEHKKAGAVEIFIERSGVSGWDEKEQLLELGAWALEVGLNYTKEKISQEKRDYYKEELRRYRMIANHKDETVLYRLRKFHELSQEEMSEQLAVGIKKYRHMERGLSDIDIELIWNAYRKFHCSPSYLLNGYIENFNTLNEIWNCVTLEGQRKIAELMQFGVKLVQER